MFARWTTRRVLITHPGGLHARPSLAIVNLVKRFQAKVRIRRGDHEAEADDILGVLSLGAPEGTEVELLASGPDAEQALDALARLFADNFGMDK